MITKFAVIPRLIILTFLAIALASTSPANADFADIDGLIHAGNEGIKSGYLAPTVGGITVSAISGPTSEPSGTATFTVVLTQAPVTGTTVAIALSSSDISEGDVTSTSPLVFDETDWSSAQTVTVTGADDAVYDGNVAYTIITAAAVSDDPEFSGVNAADVSVTNNDNELPPTVSFTSASQNKLENGGSMTITAQLSAMSGLPVTVTYSLSGSATITTDYTITPSSISIPAGSTTADLTITILDDTQDESDETVVVTMVTPTNATIGSPSVHTATITDDDGSPTLSINDVSVIEGNSATTNANFTVTLSPASGQTVTVDYATADGTAIAPGDYILTSGTLTFNPGDTSELISVPVVGDALIEIDETFFVNLSNPTNATIADNQGLGTITNDDVAGVTVDPTVLLTAELGEPKTFTVKLNTQPTKPVTIGISSEDTTEGTVLPISLTFNATNWDSPQTVTVTPVDDHKKDDAIVYKIITAPAVSQDPHYTGFNAPDVSVTNADNDAPGITIAPLAGLTTTEGEEADNIQIVLNTEPDQNVDVTLSSSDPGEGKFFNPDDPYGPRLDEIIITFTPTNWETVQEVFLIGVDDLIIDNDVVYSVGVTSASADPIYHDLPLPELAAINEDAPSIEWVLPVGDRKIYDIDSLAPILLKVRRISPEPISLVRFKRYDALNGVWVMIGEDTVAPYQVYLNPSELNFGDNQINAYAFDLAQDTASIQKYIFISRGHLVYLPLVLNQP